jgi:hypothetical protein
LNEILEMQEYFSPQTETKFFGSSEMDVDQQDIPSSESENDLMIKGEMLR